MIKVGGPVRAALDLRADGIFNLLVARFEALASKIPAEELKEWKQMQTH